MSKVLRMVSSRLNSDPKLRAMERGTKLGNEFFHSIGLAAKSPGQIPFAAVGRRG